MTPSEAAALAKLNPMYIVIKDTLYLRSNEARSCDRCDFVAHRGTFCSDMAAKDELPCKVGNNAAYVLRRVEVSSDKAGPEPDAG